MLTANEAIQRVRDTISVPLDAQTVEGIWTELEPQNLELAFHCEEWLDKVERLLEAARAVSGVPGAVTAVLDSMQDEYDRLHHLYEEDGADSMPAHLALGAYRIAYAAQLLASEAIRRGMSDRNLAEAKRLADAVVSSWRGPMAPPPGAAENALPSVPQGGLSRGGALVIVALVAFALLFREEMRR